MLHVRLRDQHYRGEARCEDHYGAHAELHGATGIFAGGGLLLIAGGALLLFLARRRPRPAHD